MGYDNMDHAGWVERNIEAHKRGKLSAKDRRDVSEGKGWFAAPDELNPFQRSAFTILGIIGGGIYNAPIEWNSVYWDKKYIIVSWRHDLATFDFAGLTTAVLLAHDAAIRISIQSNMRNLSIVLHERVPRTKGIGISVGHPTLDQAVSAHRARFPADHPIHYHNLAEAET